MNTTLGSIIKHINNDSLAMKDVNKSTPVWTASIMIATGAGFGYAMNKGQVHLPSLIQGQMSFERFTMMKLFVAELGNSFASNAIFRTINPAAFDEIQKQCACDPSHAAVLA
ncbi:Aste57867_9977 [Aphanomyces stellatus]|uniref:Aste57867_9977 protein n=1 Tax=Aphanomyces stellatus TaxID=120398 RepID=A0A485KP99_9STRA|nr:hypothetical protein As57867_009938 [Aphanomyces stellatus]VFT86855.1 Aste57867_9977 [Aphanomyces stellatus]